MTNSVPSGATPAFEDLELKLWAAADALHNNMNVAEYEHGVLGVIFTKYISGGIEAKHAEFTALQAAEGLMPAPINTAENIFWSSERSSRMAIRRSLDHGNGPRALARNAPTSDSALDTCLAV